MTLYTKAIEADSSTEDGYRICIMRNPTGYENKYNKWMPELSPSPELRQQTKKGCGWTYFKEHFIKELETKKEHFDYITAKAKEGNVTLLCVEEDPSFCHRSLVAQEIKRRNPELEVIIK